MRLAIIADTHLPRGARQLPEACVARLRAAQLILHAGDLRTLAVLEWLEALGPPVAAVQGNVDDEHVASRRPVQRVVVAAGARLGMVRAAGQALGRLARLARRFPRVDAVVFGHSHVPLHERNPATGFQIFNPGSPTERRRQPRHTMGLAHVEDGAVRFELVDLD